MTTKPTNEEVLSIVKESGVLGEYLQAHLGAFLSLSGSISPEHIAVSINWELLRKQGGFKRKKNERGKWRDDPELHPYGWGLIADAKREMNEIARKTGRVMRCARTSIYLMTR